MTDFVVVEKNVPSMNYVASTPSVRTEGSSNSLDRPSSSFFNEEELPTRGFI